jgi:L-asparaginase
MATAPEQNLTRRVVVLAAGGTIAMTGPSATPELEAQDLVAAIPGLHGVEARSLVNKPSAHLTLADQLDICRQARDVARRGLGVVVTHGTDALEETAMLCDVLHDAEAPIVFTGAIRPASAAGADGPANLVDAVSVAASEAAAGLGVLVVFGSEIHHARCARKTDTTSLVAFSSPQTGPLGRVTEGHPTIWSRIPRNPPRATRRWIRRTSTSACTCCRRSRAMTARWRRRRSTRSPTG